MRIQPKPDPASVELMGNFNLSFKNFYKDFQNQCSNFSGAQNCQDSTIMCNVFKEVLTNNNNFCVEDSKDFLNLIPGIDIKKSVLSRSELEALQAKRKQERMIRNRESAYLSRKRKKEYVAHLEKQVQELTTENNQLKLVSFYQVLFIYFFFKSFIFV